MGRASRLRAYAEAGTLGAVAAIAVLGAIVAIGGVTMAEPAPSGGDPLAPQTQTATMEPAALTTLDDAVPAIGSDVATATADDHIDDVTTGAVPDAMQDAGLAAATEARTAEASDTRPAEPSSPDRLSTVALAIADPPPDRPTSERSAIEAALIEAADANGSPDASDAPGSTLAYAGSPAMTDDPVPVAEAALDNAPAAPAPIDTASAEDPEDAAVTAEEDTDIRVVGGQGVNVRAGPGMSNGKLFALKGGTEVTLTGQETRGWLKVTDTKGRSGWIYGDFLHT